MRYWYSEAQDEYYSTVVRWEEDALPKDAEPIEREEFEFAEFEFAMRGLK